jgi:hypothetical protein
MIHHYFSPQVEIFDNKYITNIKCNLWSKSDDITEYLNYYKINAVFNDNIQLIPFDELYQGYKAYFKAKCMLEQKNISIVSKQFFEKFVINQLQSYIKFEKFVSSEWINT